MTQIFGGSVTCSMNLHQSKYIVHENQLETAPFYCITVLMVTVITRHKEY